GRRAAPSSSTSAVAYGSSSYGSAYVSSNQLLGSRDTSLDSSRSSASKSVLAVLYLSSRATFVCLAFARPRPMARPPRKRVRGGRGIGGPVYLDNFFLTPSVPCRAGRTRRGMVCPTTRPLPVCSLRPLRRSE